MVRYFPTILLLLSSCASLSVEFPYTEVRIVAPEDGAIVPDTFSVRFFAYSSGIVFRREVVYGFPDGLVERGRFPGCHRFEAVVRVNGREVGRYEGCDTLAAKVGVKAERERVQVEVRVGNTVRRATYTVVKPYPYVLTQSPTARDTGKEGLEPPVRYYRRIPFGSGDLLLSQRDGGEVLYVWNDTLEELVRGRWLKVAVAEDVALVVGEREDGDFYAAVRRDTVLSMERLDGPVQVIGSLACTRGVAYASSVGIIWLDAEGNSGLFRYPWPPITGRGCLDGMPYFSLLSDSLLTLIGRDTLTFPSPGSTEGVQVFYGYGGRLLLLRGDGEMLKTRMWDGRRWMKTYFPWEPISGRCYGPTVACVCLCPITFPMASLDRRCSVEIPAFDVEASGIRVGDRLYRVRFIPTSGSY